MYILVALSTFTGCATITTNSRMSHLPQKQPRTHSCHSTPPPTAPGHPSSTSVRTDLPLLLISHGNRPCRSNLVCLAFFTWRVFEAHVCCCM